MPKYANVDTLLTGSAAKYKETVTPDRVARGLQVYGIQLGPVTRERLNTGITEVTQNWRNRWFNQWSGGLSK